MNKQEYELFKKKYLLTFKGYYQKGRVSKANIKKSIFDNPLLLQSQKEDFWRLIQI
jgi:hypothetical protein